jgi:hypothetical protein
MISRVSGYWTLNALAHSLGAYRELLLALCETSGVPITTFSGVRFVAEADVPRLVELLEAWRSRPRLKIHLKRRQRPKRFYAPWRDGRGTGSRSADLAALDRRILQTDADDRRQGYKGA